MLKVLPQRLLLNGQVIHQRPVGLEFSRQDFGWFVSYMPWGFLLKIILTYSVFFWAELWQVLEEQGERRLEDEISYLCHYRGTKG